MKELKKSKVRFIETTHRYFNEEGKELSGVTPILGKLIEPDMYKNIPNDTLASAACRGKEIHEAAEHAALTGEITGYEEDVLAFLNATKGVKWLAAEYLVSDNQRVASSIDLVDEEGNLYDIKTTSQLHHNMLQWQLSIYAYLYELQNPGEKAGKLFGVWIRDGRCELREYKRLGNPSVEYILDYYFSNQDPSGFINPQNDYSLTDLGDIANELREIDGALKLNEAEVVKPLKEKQALLNARLIALVKEEGIGGKTIKTDNFTATIKEASIRRTFSLDLLKDKNPDFYEQNKEILDGAFKETEVKESIVCKFK